MTHPIVGSDEQSEDTRPMSSLLDSGETLAIRQAYADRVLAEGNLKKSKISEFQQRRDDNP